MQEDDNVGRSESGGEEEEGATPTPKTGGGYTCTTCGAVFSRKFNRDRHVQLNHNNIVQVSFLLISIRTVQYLFLFSGLRLCIMWGVF
jgi:hypothetical protein